MGSVYKFIKGQTKEGLNFTLVDKNTGAAVDITSANIVLTAFHPKSRTKLFDGNCVIDDAVNGTFYYNFIGADLATVGTYECEVEITFGDSKIGKIQDFYIKVEDQAPT